MMRRGWTLIRCALLSQRDRGRVASGCVTALVALLVLAGTASLAHAQGPGLYIAKAGTGRPACTSITSPAPGLTWCHDGNDLTLKVWNGSSYVGGGIAGVGSLNGLVGALAIQGTPNQVIVSALGSTIGLSLPQSIATSSSPSFAGLTLTGIAPASTECVQIDSTGLFSTSGATCGGGGGAGVSAINSATGGLALVGVANRTTVTTVGTTLTVTLPNAVSGLTSLSATTLTGTAVVGLSSITGPIRDKGGAVQDIVAWGAGSAASAAVNTIAIAAAFTACGAAGGGFVFVPPGNFQHNGVALTATHSSCTLIGAGVGASRLQFVPTGAGQVAFSSTLQVEGGIRDLTLWTADTVLLKTGISLVNVDKFIIERVTLGFNGNNWNGANSIGFKADGHNFVSGTMFFVYANRPWVFAGNATSDFGNDMYLFRHTQLLATASNPVIEVEGNAGIGSFTIDGVNDWAGGTDGFKHVATAGPGFGPGLLSFNNIRWEQTVGTAGWFINLSSHASKQSQMVALNNVSYGTSVAAPQGIRLRNVNWVTVKNFRATAILANPVLDIDSTVAGVTLENFITASSTPTFTVSGQKIVYDASNAAGDTIYYRIYQPTGTQLPLVRARSVGVNTTAPVAQLSVVGSGYFGPGGATDDGAWPLRVVAANSKTSATPQALLFASSNDAQALGFAVAIIGGATQGSRYVSFSADNGGGSGGSLILNNAGGNVGIGTTQPAARLDVRDLVIVSPNTATLPALPSGGVLQISNINANPAYAVLDTFGNQSALLFRRANGTPGAPTTLTLDQMIGGMMALGYDGAAYSDPSVGGSAGIRFFAGGTWSAGSRPTYMTFGTTPSGASAVVERMRIAANGSISATRSTLAATPLHTLTSTVAGSRSAGAGIGSDPIPPAIYGVGGPQQLTYVSGALLTDTDSTGWPCNGSDGGGQVNFGPSMVPPIANCWMPANNVGAATTGHAVQRTLGSTFSGFGIGRTVFMTDNRSFSGGALPIEQNMYGDLVMLVANQSISGTTFPGAPRVATVARYSILARHSTSNFAAGERIVLSNFVNDAQATGIDIQAGDAVDVGAQFGMGAAIQVTAKFESATNQTVEAWTDLFNYRNPHTLVSRFRVLGDGRTVISPSVAADDQLSIASLTGDTNGANIKLTHTGGAGNPTKYLMALDNNFEVRSQARSLLLRLGDDGNLTLPIHSGGGNRTLCVNNGGIVYTVASGVAC